MDIKLTKDHILNGIVFKEGTKLFIKDFDIEKKKVKKNKSKKKIAEKSDGPIESFYVTWVNSMDSVTKEITDRTDLRKLRKEVYEDFLRQDPNSSDDFWIDNIWTNDSGVSADWTEILQDSRGGIDEDVLDMIFEDEEVALKMGFLKDEGFDITTDNLEEVYVYDASSENWIEGNFRKRYPDEWLYEQVESMGVLKNVVKGDYGRVGGSSSNTIIEDNYSYFEEGFARILSDNEVNGDFKSDRINDYFVYTYMN